MTTVTETVFQAQSTKQAMVAIAQALDKILELITAPEAEAWDEGWAETPEPETDR